MQIRLKGNEIIEYATVGGFVDGGQEINDSLKPKDFDNNFRPSYYLYQDDQIIVNPNYEEPTVDIPIPEPSGPSAEQQAITDLAINSAEHDQHIQSIEEAITALAQSQMGGTN